MKNYNSTHAPVPPRIIKRNLHAILLILIFSLYALTQAQAQAQAPEKASSSYQFIYRDLHHFTEVLETAQNKGDTLQALRKYFETGSEGLKAWVSRYGTTPERMLKAIRYFPKYYEGLARYEPTLKSFEKEISRGLNGLKSLYPSEFVHIPPVYYFILFGGGGSVEMTAAMISIDYFGLFEGLDVSEFDRIGGIFPNGPLALVSPEQIPHVVIHEAAHLLQGYMQGEADYGGIYTEGNRTLLGYAIREGGADFLTFLGSGITDKTKKKYADLHEQELWQSFEPILFDDPDEHPGWFSGRSPDHPDWPFQIGYLLGFKIIEYYYDQSSNKEEAVKKILMAHSRENLMEFINIYRKKWQP